MITFTGTGLLQLQRAVYKPKYSIRLVTVVSDSEASVILPCRTMGTGVHRLTFTLSGSNVEYEPSGDGGLKFLCFSEPRFTGLRPVLGPSWQGSPVVLTTTMVSCQQSIDQLYRCNPPPLDILERMDPFGSSKLPNYGRTRDFGRCRWICTSNNGYGCTDTVVDAYGPVGNVTETSLTCLVPPELNGHEGAVEIQLALEGQHYIRPDNQGRNRVRPKIWYYLFPQRVYSRVPAGGPLRGATRLTILGEGLENYGKTLDKSTVRMLQRVASPSSTRFSHLPHARLLLPFRLLCA